MSNQSMLKLGTKVFAAIVAFASLSAASPAQDRATRIKANVPFAFETSNKHLAAGVYTVHMEQQHIVAISGVSNTAFALAMPDQSLNVTRQGKMVFDKQGDRYFLREVWLPGQSSHVHFLKSKKEKSLEIAQNAAPTSNVEVAMLETGR